jgi:hypothetical protein
VAAGTLAASLLVQLAFRPPARGDEPGDRPADPPRYVATLVRAAGCEWPDGVGPRPDGSRLAAGDFALAQGTAKLRFDGGAELVVEGPAAVRLDGSAAATVFRGNVVFRSDETAAPFTLSTPSAALVDQGTEYAVRVGPAGEEVHVFDGAVARTPRGGAGGAGTIAAGEAVRYRPSAPPGPVPADPLAFVRRVPDAAPPADPRAGLLAYDGFAYDRPALPFPGADGGSGWASPWIASRRGPVTLDPRGGLAWPPGAAAPGGRAEHAGVGMVHRRLAVPVRLDRDGLYYLSFLFRRPAGGPPGLLQVGLRDDPFENWDRRLAVGVRGPADLAFVQIPGGPARTALPLAGGTTYLAVLKVAAGRTAPDQAFASVFGPDEAVGAEEPGEWAVVSQPVLADAVYDWVSLDFQGAAPQAIDELRLGTTWAAVTAPYAGPRAGR